MTDNWKRLWILMGFIFAMFIAILMIYNQSLAVNQPVSYTFGPPTGDLMGFQPLNTAATGIQTGLLSRSFDKKISQNILTDSATIISKSAGTFKNFNQDKTIFKPKEINPQTFYGDYTVDTTIGFSERFIPVTPEIIPVPAHNGFPDGFEAPKDLRVEWRLCFTIKNTMQNSISNLLLTEHLGAELEIDPATVERTNLIGSKFSYQRNGNIKIEWVIPQLKPDQEATLSFIIYTRTLNGHQLYSETTTPLLPKYLNSGATLSYYNPCKKVLKTEPVPVWVIEKGYLKVALSANYFDWLIRKQGIFAAEPVVIDISTNQNVTLTFSQFNNLESVLPEGGQIATYYYFGDNLPDAGDYGWIRAVNLNSYSRTVHGAAGETNVVWKLWPKIIINGATQAGDYQDTGYLTFTILETSNYVDLNAELKLDFPEGVTLETSDLFH